MSETKQKRRWLRFSIRELLLVTAIAALAAGWYFDRRQMERTFAEQQTVVTPFTMWQAPNGGVFIKDGITKETYQLTPGKAPTSTPGMKK